MYGISGAMDSHRAGAGRSTRRYRRPLGHEVHVIVVTRVDRRRDRDVDAIAGVIEHHRAHGGLLAGRRAEGRAERVADERERAANRLGSRLRIGERHRPEVERLPDAAEQLTSTQAERDDYPTLE